jgi:hypothetical protein
MIDGQQRMADVGTGIRGIEAGLAELDAGTIGSALPEAISTGMSERFDRPAPKAALSPEAAPRRRPPFYPAARAVTQLKS